jgi:hypothetical protein
MDGIAEGARQVLDHIEKNGTVDRYVTAYIRAVRQYALNAQWGDGQGAPSSAVPGISSIVPENSGYR